MYLMKGFNSPYYKESHYALQKAARLFFDQHVKPEALAHETSNKRPSVELIAKMGQEGVELNAYVVIRASSYSDLRTGCDLAQANIFMAENC